VKKVQLSSDNRMIAVLSYDDTISVRDIASNRILHMLEFPDTDIQEVVCSNDGQWLCALGVSGRIRAWNLETGQLTTNTSLKTSGAAKARLPGTVIGCSLPPAGANCARFTQQTASCGLPGWTAKARSRRQGYRQMAVGWQLGTTAESFRFGRQVMSCRKSSYV
jgi:hypothetical protein